jgi:hypothetical protein
MRQQLSSDELYSMLMEIHNDVRATERYEVSYYLLSALLYLASEMGDEGRLLEVSREASERRAWLDTHEPMHPLATHQGQPSAFETLASLAITRAEKGQATHPEPNRERG